MLTGEMTQPEVDRPAFTWDKDTFKRFLIFPELVLARDYPPSIPVE
jgi:hypothetical protein